VQVAPVLSKGHEPSTGPAVARLQLVLITNQSGAKNTFTAIFLNRTINLPIQLDKRLL